MKKIKEVIIVEGKHDVNKIKSVVDADFIVTNGSEVSTETKALIKEVSKTRDIIIFTDPDNQGERIRKMITSIVPDAKHAFVDKSKAQGKRNIGIEYVDSKYILEALKNCKESSVNQRLTWKEYVSTCLMTEKHSKLIRNEIALRLNLGIVNNKQLFKRLNMFGYNLKDLNDIIYEVKKDFNL